MAGLYLITYYWPFPAGQQWMDMLSSLQGQGLLGALSCPDSEKSRWRKNLVLYLFFSKLFNKTKQRQSSSVKNHPQNGFLESGSSALSVTQDSNSGSTTHKLRVLE